MGERSHSMMELTHIYKQNKMRVVICQIRHISRGRAGGIDFHLERFQKKRRLINGRRAATWTRMIAVF
jgi:hypothetical protein